ncbi:MAG: twin-arginine translocation signal domain-containing protein [Acidobacteria bacterium]|nr:twin-arginine translocation signal domain-containing protein [Acidobacteriota bacterium]MCH8266206.1 twin-arginine translocation signal domain-containing protein [Acidobacteriota bacterium]MCZ6751556.1 twin-arginine translocation signal domain-containing protein [Acidobacteriota bacterium]
MAEKKERAEQKEQMVRRRFLKQAGLGTAALAASGPLLRQAPLLQEAQAAGVSNRRAIVFLLGDTLIPSEPDDPGYKDFEWYGITEEAMKRLSGISDENFEAFNQASKSFFEEKCFLDLDANQRAEYLNLIIDGGSFTDKELLKKLQSVYRLVRIRVFSLFYQNFPEHFLPRDAKGIPILRPGDQHQITNPNTPNLVTAWDTTGFKGPLRWEEEEERRAFFKKVRWKE